MDKHVCTCTHTTHTYTHACKHTHAIAPTGASSPSGEQLNRPPHPSASKGLLQGPVVAWPPQAHSRYTPTLACMCCVGDHLCASTRHNLPQYTRQRGTPYGVVFFPCMCYLPSDVPINTIINQHAIELIQHTSAQS